MAETVQGGIAEERLMKLYMKNEKLREQLKDIGELVGIMIWAMRLSDATLNNEEGCEYHNETLVERVWMASKRMQDGLDASTNLINRMKSYIPEHYLKERGE